ncbi:DUF433 domain-containing protein [Fulvimarina sp. 2208YS6-2-32]|uniref:DUF433 domain-containing protein n=1 Tax=Fulvimarina uroteuthidis TaxID=3098149 RepID=A0ABU5I0K0_9HYPH|nr:DUF433 domain-containing protein [Fulvimarina sp. 2208YS6-2-32]MDY8108595.1 DUF433 domain-containing protein [Fulvimarina sp. 2208YS6-2-32]
MNWNDLFESKPDVMSGAVVFKETRIPIEALFDNLASGLSLDEVLQNFPRIGRERAEAALQLAARELHHSAA